MGMKSFPVLKEKMTYFLLTIAETLEGVCGEGALPEGLGRRPSDTGLATDSFFSGFLFCKKSLICLAGKSMTPRRGNTILFRSSQQLPSLRLGPFEGRRVSSKSPSRVRDRDEGVAGRNRRE